MISVFRCLPCVVLALITGCAAQTKAPRPDWIGEAIDVVWPQLPADALAVSAPFLREITSISGNFSGELWGLTMPGSRCVYFQIEAGVVKNAFYTWLDDNERDLTLPQSFLNKRITSLIGRSVKVYERGTAVTKKEVGSKGISRVYTGSVEIADDIDPRHPADPRRLQTWFFQAGICVGYHDGKTDF